MIPSENLRDRACRTYLWVRILSILTLILTATIVNGAEKKRFGLVLIAPTAAGTPNIALNARHPLWVKWPPVNDRSGTEHMLMVRLGRLLDVSEGLFNVREENPPSNPLFPYRPLLPERLEQVLKFGRSEHPSRPRTPFRIKTSVAEAGSRTTLNRLLLPLTLGEPAPDVSAGEVWVTEAKSWDAVARDAAPLDRVLVLEYPPLQSRDHSRVWLWKGFSFGNSANLKEVPMLEGSLPGLLTPEILLTLLVEPERMPTSPLQAGPDDDPSIWVQFLAERGKQLTTGMLVFWGLATLIGFVLVAKEVAGGIAVGLLTWAAALPVVTFLGSQAHRLVEVPTIPLIIGVLTVLLIGGVAILLHKSKLLTRPSEDGILAATFWLGWIGTGGMLLSDPVFSLFSPAARPWSVPWPSEFTAAMVGYSCLIPLSRPVWSPTRLGAAIVLGGVVLAKLAGIYSQSPVHLATICAFTILAWLCATGIRIQPTLFVLVANPFVLVQITQGQWTISKFGAQLAATPERATDFFTVVPGLGAWSVLLVVCVLAGLALFSSAYSGYRLRRTAFGRANLRWVQTTFLAIVGLTLTEPSWIGLGGTFLMVTVPPILALGAHEPELF